MTEWLARLAARHRVVTLFWGMNAVIVVALLAFALR